MANMILVSFAYGVRSGRSTGVGHRPVLDVGMVQRRVHRPDRGFQGRRPSGQAGGVELQRVRDRQGPRVLRDDARRAQLAGSVETAAVRNVR